MEAILEKYLFPYLKQLLECDADLIHRSLHEDCISHRLALYMSNGIESGTELRVDFQYNRNFRNPKELKGFNTVPDIILHKRESNLENILIIEAKKASFNEGDQRKLNDFILEKYSYQVSVGVLYLPTRDHISLICISREKIECFKVNKATRVVEKTKSEINETPGAVPDLKFDIASL
jgi:hypothetical protein